MMIEKVEAKLTELVHNEPFVPFVVELTDGQEVIVPHPPAFDHTGAGFIGLDGGLVDFEFKNVKAIRYCSSVVFNPKSWRECAVTVKEIEEKVIELKLSKPFVPFVFEMADGQTVEVSEPCLAINESGAGFFGRDGALIDVDFENVRSIHSVKMGAVA